MYVCKYESDGTVTQLVQTEAIYRKVVDMENLHGKNHVGIIAKLPTELAHTPPYEIMQNKLLKVSKVNDNGTVEVVVA